MAKHIRSIDSIANYFRKVKYRFMRIFSPFKDFYDGVGAHGHDKRDAIYFRETTPIQPKDVPTCFNTGTSYRLSRGKEPYSNYAKITVKKEGRFSYIWLTEIDLYFCGKYYKGFKAHTTADTTELARWEYQLVSRGTTETWKTIFWDYPQVVKFLANLGYVLTEERWRATISLESHFHREISRAQLDWLIENRVVAMVREDPLEIETRGWFKEPHLGNYDFFRKMDPNQVFQEIDMYVSGVLATNRDPIVELTEEEHVATHGMDKWSFRTMPTKKSKKT
jgi:hypothetical protein